MPVAPLRPEYSIDEAEVEWNVGLTIICPGSRRGNNQTNQPTNQSI